MNCTEIQNWLLSADDRELARADHTAQSTVDQHLAGCYDCRQVADDLRQLEAQWRSLPLPPEASAAKTRFLMRLADQQLLPIAARVAASDVNSSGRVRVRSQPLAGGLRWALAASLLLACGGLIYQFGPSSEAQAAPDVVQRMIDWHLELSAADADQRQEIFDQRAIQFTQALDEDQLPADDAELGRKLLDEAQWLVKNVDPLAEASHFSKLADRMLGRLSQESAQKHAGKLAKVAREYSKAEDAVRENLHKLELDGKVVDARLEPIHDRQLRRKSALTVLVDSMPSSSQKAVKAALDPTAKPIHKGGKHRNRDKRELPI